MSNNLALTNKQTVTLTILFLAVMILTVYWPVQNYEFSHYDDTLYITKNYLAQQVISGKNIAAAFADVNTGHWHPLTMISHMLDWQLFGDRAGGHHWTSVIIHIFNTILLFLFLHMATGAIWRSAFVAALFAVHPINVESVAWIAERKNVLSTFFWMTAMLSYVWYVRKPGWQRYLLIILSFALGLMSKPMLVTLPFVLLLLDYWPLKRTKIYQQGEDQTTAVIAVKKEKISLLILEKIPLFVLSAVSIGLTLYAARSVKTIATLEAVPIMKRFANVIVSYGLYIKKLFWPFDLAVFYPLNYNIPFWHIFLAASLIIIITIFVCAYFRKFPYLPVGWFWYLGTLVPVIGIVQVGAQSMADRYAYVPFIGLSIMIAWGMFGIMKKLVSAKIIVIIFTCIVVVLMILTHFQIKHWENSITLYQRAIKVTKENFVAHLNLGLYLNEINKPRQAIYYLNIARKFNKEDTMLHGGLGIALARMGKHAEAVEEYKTALRIQPRNARAHNNLGVSLMRLGRNDEAEKHFREAIKLELEYPHAHYYLARILEKKGRKEEAAFHYQEAKRISSEFKISVEKPY